MKISEPPGARLTGVPGEAPPDVAARSVGAGSGSASQLVAAAAAANAGLRQELRRIWRPVAASVSYGLTRPGPDWSLSRCPTLIVAEVHS